MKYLAVWLLITVALLSAANNALSEQDCVYAQSVVKTIKSNQARFTSEQEYLIALAPHTNFIKENCND